MTDHQTMIREVCERLGKAWKLSRNKKVVWFDLTGEGDWVRFNPLTDYNDTHLLIEWMKQAGWDSIRISGDHMSDEFGYEFGYVWTSHLGAKHGAGSFHAEDFRLAVLTAAWRALTDE